MVENNPNQKKDFYDMLNMMDVAKEIRNLSEKAQDQLDIDKRKDDIVKRLIAADKVQGGNLTEKDAKAAFDFYVKNKYDFKAPNEGLATKLANFYVDRKKIYENRVKPVIKGGLILSGLVAATIGAIAGVNKIHEKYVENNVENAFNKKIIIEKSLPSLYNHISNKRCGEGIEVLLNGAVENVNYTDDFFKKYIVNGSAEETVNQDNVDNVKELLKSIDNYLGVAENSVTKVSTVLELERDEKKLYQAILTIAKENEVIEETEKQHSQANIYLSSINIPQLSNLVGDMKYTHQTLNQEYDFIIYRGEESKSGVWRKYHNDNRELKGTKYYLIVQAIDSDGKKIPQKIKNEENNNVEMVRMWGERVPENVFNKVKEDAQDGIIENNKFAHKSKGYINVKTTLDGVTERVGQITRW
jgi:hypothetical protein